MKYILKNFGRKDVLWVLWKAMERLFEYVSWFFLMVYFDKVNKWAEYSIYAKSLGFQYHGIEELKLISSYWISGDYNS